MILILNEDHTHYSDTFRNIFEENALHKRHFPDGPQGIKMRKGGATHAIVCHFCPYACSNDDYAFIVTWQPCTLTSSGAVGYALDS